MVVNNRLREYLVYVPKEAKRAAARGEDVPLVFALHGSGMTMYMQFDYFRWWEVADKEGFILVAPDVDQQPASHVVVHGLDERRLRIHRPGAHRPQVQLQRR